MFNRRVVQQALNKTWALGGNPGNKSVTHTNGLSSETSRLIYDIFGGEILKTHKKKDWHFYNRINGKRIDFTRSEMVKSFENKRFEDLISTPDETNNYFTQEDYSTFYIRFIRTFEEAIGLNNYRINLTT
jgi:hypothetical protein